MIASIYDDSMAIKIKVAIDFNVSVNIRRHSVKRGKRGERGRVWESAGHRDTVVHSSQAITSE